MAKIKTELLISINDPKSQPKTQIPLRERVEYAIDCIICDTKSAPRAKEFLKKVWKQMKEAPSKGIPLQRKHTELMDYIYEYIMDDMDGGDCAD